VRFDWPEENNSDIDDDGGGGAAPAHWTLKVPLPPEAAVGDAPTVCSQRAAMPTCQTYMKGE
jgi:hypothetical protein